MIQRLQTVYLLLAAVLLLLSLLAGTVVIAAVVIAAVTAAGALADIFLYRRRPLQASLCAVLMFLGVAYYLAVGVVQHQLGGTLQFSWPMAMPALAVVCLFLARKRIVKDEKLVRSLDRIR